MTTHKTHSAIGLISGTSADGVDATLIQISRRPLKIKLQAFLTLPYPKKLRRMVLEVGEGKKVTVEELALLDRQLGEHFAKAALKVCKKGQKLPTQISWIGSHGQTVFHSTKATVQLGEPSIIAQRTGITTVADFRQADITVGGLGAPLTPYFNYHYFKNNRAPVLFLNIGGIANLTYIPKGSKPDQVIGFDTGPGNMIIDGVMASLTHGRQQYDKNGALAATGTVDYNWIQQLLKDRFIKKRPPKACGREEYGALFQQGILKQAKRRRLLKQDMIATVTALTAESIAYNINKFLMKKESPKELIVGGGGAKNKTLMTMLAETLRELDVISSDQKGLPIDAAEAIAFAFLAGETVAGRPGNLPSVTGAKQSVILGKILSV